MSIAAFFVPTPDGQRFCIHHPAAGPGARGAIVYLHPFAEEMHKARRMAAMQARALAKAGFDVLQIDLLGCGDSSGDFGDATWQDWIDDAIRARDWLRRRTDAPFWYWGLRTGGLLATDAAARLNEPAGLLLWNPVTSGKRYLEQFLRLKLAGEMLAGRGKGAMNAIRHELASGRGVEIAGYQLSSAMADSLERLEMNVRTPLRIVRWLETAPLDESALPHAARTQVEKLRANCADVRTRSVKGSSFWQTTEIEEAPDLVTATLTELADVE